MRSRDRFVKFASVSIGAIFCLALLTACPPRDQEPPPEPPPDDGIPKGLADLPFLQDGWSESHGSAEPGKLSEVERDKRTGILTDELDLMPSIEEAEEEPEDLSGERVPDLGALAGTVEFEFYDVASNRFFTYAVDRAELAKASRAVSELEDENQTKGEPPSREEIAREDDVRKSWSNSTDNRIRRAVADGFSDTNSIYQRLADYGGCSATVLSATSTRMVAITAGHCVFVGNNFSSSKLRPRRDGSTSPSWGSWSAYAFGYYPAYLNNDCENNFVEDCIQHDIALVIASPDSGASPPRGMGWGYRPKGFLDSHSKYRRGYPGCSQGHSPSPCTTNNLYGDGALSVGSFSHQDHDSWNRQIRFSSDTNGGDSGSGLYYYRDGNPYVFAVCSAEPSSCKTNCSSSRPNYARRITPQFYDFINSVI